MPILRLDGKLRWLEMLKCDEELAQESKVELTEIRDRAAAILQKLETKRSNKNQHSSGLFTLRSARLAWQVSEGKGNPYMHRLTLHCTIDTRLWTSEGTEQVRQEKAADVAKKITQMESKGDLLATQQAYVKRLNSTLTRINTPFDRPRKPLYKGQSHVVVGLSMGLEKPTTIVVWDAYATQVLAQYGTRQLYLGFRSLRRNHLPFPRQVESS